MYDIFYYPDRSMTQAAQSYDRNIPDAAIEGGNRLAVTGQEVAFARRHDGEVLYGYDG